MAYRRTRRKRHLSSQARAELFCGLAVWFVALSILPSVFLFHHWFIPGYRIPFLPF